MSKRLSIYLSGLLRHHPERAGLDMDTQGWVSVEQLIHGVNAAGRYTLTLPQLQQLVAEDEKGRYRFSEDGLRIRACQGHSIPWVQPITVQMEPPEFLYHGTTARALELIRADGAIRKMKRHAVHLQAAEAKAWQSARRWRGQNPVVLKVAAGALHKEGMTFGRADNEVWCAEQIPFEAVCEVLYAPTAEN